MKKLIIWLAKIFNVNLTVERIIVKEKVVEKQIALKGVIEGDVTVKGNLYVIGEIYVAGNISAYGEITYGLSPMDVKMKADGEISSYILKEE